MRRVTAAVVLAAFADGKRVSPQHHSLVENAAVGETPEPKPCRRRRCRDPSSPEDPLAPHYGEAAAEAAAAEAAAAEAAAAEAAAATAAPVETGPGSAKADAAKADATSCRRRRCSEGGETASSDGEEGSSAGGSEGESGRRRSTQFDTGEEGGRRRRAPPPPLDEDAQKLGPQCQRFLDIKKFSGPTALKAEISDYIEPHRSGTIYDWKMPCPINQTAQELYHPNPASSIPGVPDTTPMACKFGSITMHETFKTYTDERGRVNRQTALQGGTCCGVKPHFNWVIGTCEQNHPEGQFCAHIPDCAKTGTPKINYLATYQYDGSQFVMMDDSTAGDLSATGVAGNYWEGTGFVAQNASWAWRNGDWTMKYAPWAREKGINGPRGVAPPAGLWVLSTENFYYGALYMLSQVNINLEGHKQPTDTNCWLWELDPIEGSVGWHTAGTEGPGNLNMLYGTNNAQVSGCMPLSYSAKQMNGLRDKFHSPEIFQPYCKENPDAEGCRPWENKIDWSGGKPGSQRFEQFWDEPYVFAVVLDARGSWTYRWIPEEDGSTGWPGVGRHSAARTLVARPRAVTDPEGLETDVRGHVKEAVILQPGMNSEESCLRSSSEEVNWAFGSEVLGSMGYELGENGVGGRFEGAQNWWNHFTDTEQLNNYPVKIMGIPKETVRSVPLTCNSPDTWACDCRAGPKERNEEELAEREEEYNEERHAEHAAENAAAAAERAAAAAAAAAGEAPV